MQQKTLVLYDFDGTLTNGDSLLRFLLFSMPRSRLIWRFPLIKIKLLALWLSGKWQNGKAKELVFEVYFKGRSKAELDQLGQAFCQQKLQALLYSPMMQQLKQDLAAGAHVALVSASVDIWLAPFCQAHGIDMICTELDYENGIFTGKFATPNCNGAEKARRIQVHFQLSDFEKIVAYGNSKGDAAMFELADEPWLRRGKLLRQIK